MCDLIDNFEEFNITSIHKERNHKEYSLVVSTSMFTLDDPNNENYFKVKTLFWLVVPNNEDLFQGFDNDNKMLFLFVNFEGEEDTNASLEP